MPTAQRHDETQPKHRRPRVLMLTHRVPYPPDRGDRIRAYHLLKAMSQRFDVTLAAIADEPVTPQTLAHLETLTSQVLLAQAQPMLQRVAATSALLTGKAITPAALFDRTLARHLIRLHRLAPFDTVLTYCTGMIGYTKALLAEEHAPRHVLDLVDVDSQKWARYAEQSRGPMRLVYQAEARRLSAVEAGQAVPFDAVTVISDAEATHYQQTAARQQPIVVRNGVDLDHFHPAAVTREPVIIFTGVMSYKPNIDAVTWFARQVMPRVLAAVPDARFDIVGKSPCAAVLALGEQPGVRVVGPVDDTATYLQNSAIAVAPMRIAPGVQNKVLEAMACGLPVVCSSAAAMGIDAQPGEHLLVCNDPASYASQCARLLLNPDERIRLGTAARYRVEQRYEWSAAVEPMLDLLMPTTLSPLVESL